MIKIDKFYICKDGEITKYHYKAKGRHKPSRELNPNWKGRSKDVCEYKLIRKIQREMVLNLKISNVEYGDKILYLLLAVEKARKEVEKIIKQRFSLRER